MSDHDSPIGKIGVLSVATRGAAGPGEVILKIRGGSESWLAWSDTPLPRGTSVLITGDRGHRALSVEPWAQAA